MSDSPEAPPGTTIRPELADLSVNLSGSMLFCDAPDLIWTTWEGQLVYGDEEQDNDVVLAEAKFATVDFDRLEAADISLGEALDEYSGDFTPFCAMADGYGLDEALQDQLASYATGMVVVDRVRVPAPFRGRKYGLLLTAVALIELGRQRVAVAMPAAFEVQPGSPGRQQADRRNIKLWEEFGFVRFADDAYYLDTDLTTLSDSLAFFKTAAAAGPPLRVVPPASVEAHRFTGL